jgi:hypothetical protein
VLPAVQGFLAPYPATADPRVIYHSCDDDPRITGLDNADRHLARALLHADEPINYYVNGHGQLELVGQHRVCWARTAGVAAVPVWVGTGTVRPPRGAVLLQRG